MNKLVSYGNLSTFYDCLKSNDLADKANSSDVYTKQEVDALLAALEARIAALENPNS